ncbi:DUF3160 domain-containing protein [Xylanibacter muris]|uniref:DUF3160 domain-containing protein n=1 Tax=Xylanibacter muris TaxID=2736290 RepID=A0ABX2AJG8_9BACT|nr:DUF3160 domain-containing protein [Xylanibacter muris]NPD90928.1 DUF3160 domain-containing protein [Xylanibacter muris]
MKKRLFYLSVIFFMAVLPLSGHKQKVFVPVGSKLDVEGLINGADLNMDISELSLSDLRILRNSFAARQGYLFMDYTFRAVFGHTTWYDSLMFERDATSYDQPLKYSKQEIAFINKIKAREAELKRRNFKCRPGEVVNTDNIVNTFQLEEYSVPLYERLAKDGFAIVPRNNIQFFHCYENNDYHNFPNFITTDMHLQLVHIYFSKLLQDVEENRLRLLLSEFFRGMLHETDSIMNSTSDKRLRKTAAFGVAFFAVGCSLVDGGGRYIDKALAAIPAEYGYRQMAENELVAIDACTDAPSELLGYINPYFMYSMFRPRGNYTSNENLKRYFRAMMWLQHASGCISDRSQLNNFMLMAGVMNARPYLRTLMERISAPIDLLVGRPDGVSVIDLADIMAEEKLDIDNLWKSKRAVNNVASRLDAMSRSRARIRPKEQLSCSEKISLLPQRYVYDAEVLQELVDVKTRPRTLRGCPKGLDVFAALGTGVATRILADELDEFSKWPEYGKRLEGVKTLMPQMTKDSTLYNIWMSALTGMVEARDSRMPYFMQTPKWEKKNLNAALASWAELKHDMVLYMKQPMAAECGGAIPDPIVVGYVEPNVAYWKKSLDLIRYAADVLSRNGLMTSRSSDITRQLMENTEFMLRISEKELAGKRLTENEFWSIEKMGSTYEWLTLDIIRRGTETGFVWEDVTGPDKSVSVVSDVYTANGTNNPNKGVLHEGVGYVDDLFVVVEINGLLYLTRGAVFSYREFLSAPGERHTDEEWQKMLEKNPRKGVPAWMDEIIIRDTVPADNELIFYSSGC